MNSHFSPTPQPPYTEEQLRRFREEFAPQVSRYRHHQGRWVISLVVISLPFLFAIPFVIYDHAVGYFVTLIVSLIAHYIWGWLGTPSMVCPACQHGVDLDHVANHCPHCGAAPVSHVGLYDTPFCKPCGRELTKEDE